MNFSLLLDTKRIEEVMKQEVNKEESYKKSLISWLLHIDVLDVVVVLALSTFEMFYYLNDSFPPFYEGCHVIEILL